MGTLICPICHHREYRTVGIATDHLVSGRQFPLVRCSHCGLVITQNPPQGEAFGAYYKSIDYISHSNINKGFFNQLYHVVRRCMLRKKRRWLQAYCRGGNGSRLLDIGCGTGYFAHYMQQRGYEVACVEQDADARAFALRKFGLNPLADLLDAPFPESHFHAITLWHVLEHIESLEEHLGHISRLLKSDGVLVIAVPNPTSYDACYFGGDWAAYDVPRHLWHFTPDSLTFLLERYGFVLQRVHPMYFDAYYIALMSQKQLGRKGGNAFFRAFLIGLGGTIRTLRTARAASSLVYIFQKR